MDDNNKEAQETSRSRWPAHCDSTTHPPVIAELDELEALLLMMMSTDLSSIAPESRQHLLALAYRLVSTALDKATSSANSDA